MMVRIFIQTILFAITTTVSGQKYVLQEGTITFFSEAALEDIKADNTKISSIFNSATGEIAFSLPNNEFQFDKKLMQQHFNEKYMESDKYPRSTFSGKIIGFDKSAESKQSVRATGKLTIHGVTKEIDVPGTMELGSSGLSMKSVFIVKLADYKIKIPQLLWQNIAEQVEVTVDIKYKAQ